VDEWLSRCAFNTEITGSIPVEGTNIGRPAYQCGQLSVKQPLIALQVQLLTDLPNMESNPIGRSALFAKQMDEQLWFESTALRLWERGVSG
jgi:hypothetical protein